MSTIQTTEGSPPTMLGEPRKEIIEISNAGDINKLRRLPGGVRSISLRITNAMIDDGRRKEFERRLEKQLSACGCNEGSIAGILYLVALPTIIFSGQPWPSTVGGWLGVFGGLIVALVIGKVFGLVKARIRLSIILAEIKTIFISPAQQMPHA